MSQRSSDLTPPQATQTNPDQLPGVDDIQTDLGTEREQMQRQMVRLEALHALSLEVVAQHEPDLVITRALGLAVRMLDAESSGYWSVTEAGYLLSALNGESDVPVGTRLEAGSGLTGQVVGRGRGVLVEDYRQFEGRIPGFSDVWRSLILAPVKRGETVLGVLAVSNNARSGVFNGADLAILERLATVCAISLENARLLEVSRRAELDSRRRAEISGAINTLSFDLTAALEPKAMLERILERATALIGGDLGGVFLHHDAPELEVVTRFGDGWITQPRLGFGATGRAVETGQSVRVEDYPNWEHRTPAPGLRWQSAISAPLRRADKVLGAITLADTQQTGRYSSLDLFALERFAALASIALENARLFELEQRRARDERIRSSVSNALVRLRTVGELCRAVVAEVASSLAYTHVCMLQLEADGPRGAAVERLRVQAQVGYRSLPEFLPLHGSFSGQVVRSRQPTYMPDTFDQTGDQAGEYQRSDPELVFAIGVPLLGRDGVLGALVVESAGTPKLTTTDLEMLVSLAAPISVALENATLHESLERRARELEVLGREAQFAATHDTLTGLPNRRAFEVDANQLLKQQLNNQAPFCLVVIDLEGFKAVNDNFGHASGDEALKLIAQTLRIIASHQANTSTLHSSSGDDVFAYRVGGDEFFLLIENDRSNAFKLVQQVIATVQGLEFGAGSELQVTPNVGLAEYPTDAPDLDNLLTLADTRMYAAKRAGKPVLEPDEFEHPPVPRRRKEDHGE
jgi:diguanylate cyclase (GGDEF)-like protein